MAQKTIKARQDSESGLQVGENHITAVVNTASDVNGIHIDESGVSLRGKMSLMVMPENIRVGGFWTQNTAWQQMLPSTMAFPVPNLIINPPIAGLKTMAEQVAWAQSFLV